MFAKKLTAWLQTVAKFNQKKIIYIIFFLKKSL